MENFIFSTVKDSRARLGGHKVFFRRLCKILFRYLLLFFFFFFESFFFLFKIIYNTETKIYK